MVRRTFPFSRLMTYSIDSGMPSRTRVEFSSRKGTSCAIIDRAAVAVSFGRDETEETARVRQV